MGGKIETRGTGTFETTVRGAEVKLAEAGLPTASWEIREALRDLSRPPESDLTGAIQHARAALECVTRETSGEPTLTLGKVLRRYPDPIPKPLDAAVEKARAYTSNMGSRIQEGSQSSREEVEFVVGLAATVATYLAAKVSGAK